MVASRHLGAGSGEGVEDPGQDLDLPVPETDIMPTSPESLDRLSWRGHFGEDHEMRRFHYDAVEIRTMGGSFNTPGPGTSWLRLLVPVVEDEQPSDFVRLATLADMANGNSQVLDPAVHVFVNPDISLHLHRLPRGDWIGMRSVSYPQPYGIGMADTAVYDLDGCIGRVIQSQYLDRR